MTNLEKLRTLSAEELYDYLDCPKKLVPNMNCISNKSCKNCISEWLNKEIGEPNEESQKPKRPPLPKPFDMDNLECQLQSMSIKAIVQNVLACGSKINKIIDVLKEAEDVVPVVRCEDCVHSCISKSAEKYMCKKCSGFLRSENDYCSYGERKADAT